MNPSRMPNEIPDWKLERYLLGELDSEELERIRLDAESNESLRLRLQALSRSDQEILQRYPAEWMSQTIQRKLNLLATLRSDPEMSRWSWFGSRPVVTVGAVAALFLGVLMLPDMLTRHEQDSEIRPLAPSIRIKGLASQLRIFRKTETGSERLQDGARAGEHDLILIQYHAVERAYGAILSVDGSGAVTRHLPTEGSNSLTLLKDSTVSLDFAYELDDAPHWEKFYFVTSESPFDVETVVEAARLFGAESIQSIPEETEAKSDSLALPPVFGQFIFTLQKEASDAH